MFAASVEHKRSFARFEKMKKFSIILGFLLIPATVGAQNLDGKSLYEYIHAMTKQSFLVDFVELPVERFTAAIYYDNPEESVEVSVGEEHVDKAIATRISEICGPTKEQRDLCKSLQEHLKEIAYTITWQRQLAKDLQMIATGYESGISDYPGHNISIVSKIASISRIWKSSNVDFTTPVILSSAAGLPYPEAKRQQITDELHSLVTTIKELEIINENQKKDLTEEVAAVWRYKNGVFSVQNTEGNCSGEDPGLDELALLKKRWCTIEDKLKSIWTLVRTRTPEEEASFPTTDFILFPSWKDKNSNIFVWIREDDIGLEWTMPLEPVMPMLYTKNYSDCVRNGQSAEDCAVSYPTEIIRGGTYPDEIPEPAETQGVCSHPFGKSGYLCRRIIDDECASDPIAPVTIEDEDDAALANAQGIILTQCEPEQFLGPISVTPSGPDMCEIGGWKTNVHGVEGNVQDTPKKQSGEDGIRPDQCSSCAIDFYCADACGPASDRRTQFAYTDPRDEHGRIGLCLPNEVGPQGILHYLALHESIHAQQLCNQTDQAHGDLFGTRVNCCANEREAYMAQCVAMAQDGILERAGVTIDECASAGTNGSCSRFAGDGENACSTTAINPQEMWNKVNQVIRDGIDNGWLNPQPPLTCEDAINNLDKRVQTARNSLPLSCSPGCISEYENTIGNNLCFAGQCLEQSHEWQRTIPGRMTVTAQDEAYPWDACAVEDPQLGRFFAPPALSGPHFPQYNPERLYNQLDMAVCQLNGLPASTPPILCAFDPERRLNLPLADYVSMAQNLAEQPQQYIVPAQGMLSASAGIAARVADGIFLNYMKNAARSFADIFNIASEIIDDIGETKFPSVMCPRVGDANSCKDFEKQ